MRLTLDTKLKTALDKNGSKKYVVLCKSDHGSGLYVQIKQISDEGGTQTDIQIQESFFAFYSVQLVFVWCLEECQISLCCFIVVIRGSFPDNQRGHWY